MRRKTIMAALTLAAAFAAALPALAGDTVRLGVTPWPPYVGAALPEGGATGLVVGAALKSVGADLVPLYQEALSIEAGFDHLDLDGFFPVYATSLRDKVCLMSGQIGSSPLGLAERADAPVRWHQLADLAPYVIGIVRNYSNAESFDRMVALGTLRVVRAADDTTNLRNLLDGTVDLAVIDRNVMEWLLRDDPALAGAATAMRFNDRPIAERPLHACFRRDDRGRAARDLLDEGLARIDAPLLTAQWFQRMTVGR